VIIPREVVTLLRSDLLLQLASLEQRVHRTGFLLAEAGLTNGPLGPLTLTYCVAFVRLISVVDALDSGVEPGSDLHGNAQGTAENREQKRSQK
jgi:hypothetical protein